jgi:hypothetical protein
MAHYYLLVGAGGCGKSTVQRNLRLRWDGVFSSEDHQVIPSKDVVVAGRILFRNGKKLIKLPGGDSYQFDRSELFTLDKMGVSKVLWEQYDVPTTVIQDLLTLGHKVTIIHLRNPLEVCIARREHRSPRSTGNMLPYYPAETEWQDKRDAKVTAWGVAVVYVDCDGLRSRCETVEKIMGIKPVHDNVALTDELNVDAFLALFFGE